MRSPFSAWTVGQFRALFTAAGFRGVHIRIDACSIRYPSCEQFLLREAASTPLAPLVNSANADARSNLIRALESALADHLDDDGVVCPLETYVAFARLH